MYSAFVVGGLLLHRGGDDICGLVLYGKRSLPKLKKNIGIELDFWACCVRTILCVDDLSFACLSSRVS